MSIFHCQAMACITLAWAGMWGGVAIAADVPAGIAAACTQRVHPVLIRNEHNSLAQVVVDAKRAGLQVKQLTFSLRGTDDLADIDSLRLFYSGDKQPAELDHRGPRRRHRLHVVHDALDAARPPWFRWVARKGWGGRGGS